MQDSIFSIIIPIFNVEKYLKECLDSVINQTYSKLDIILIDDGSIDSSLEIAKTYLNDPRVLLISKPNGGLSSARNMGLELMQGTRLRELLLGGGGDECLSSNTQTHTFSPLKHIVSTEQIKSHFKIISNHFIQTDLEDITELIIQDLPSERYIHFLDSDDYFLPDCIKHCYENIQKTGCEILSHHYQNFIQEKQIFQNHNPYPPQTYPLSLDYLKNFPSSPFCWVWKGAFKTEILNRYILRFSHRMDYEDCDFGTILFCLGKKLVTTNQAQLIYRVRQHSLSNFSAKDPFPPKLPKHLEEIRDCFNTYFDLKVYFGCYCYLKIAEKIQSFLHSNPNLPQQYKPKLEKFIITHIAMGSSLYFTPILQHKNKSLLDPLHIKELLAKLVTPQRKNKIIQTRIKMGVYRRITPFQWRLLSAIKKLVFKPIQFFLTKQSQNNL